MKNLIVFYTMKFSKIRVFESWSIFKNCICLLCVVLFSLRLKALVFKKDRSKCLSPEIKYEEFHCILFHEVFQSQRILIMLHFSSCVFICAALSRSVFYAIYE